MKKKHKILLLTLVILTLVSLYITFTNYFELPQEIPNHFNMQGEPDAWSQKSSLLILPGIQVFLILLAFVVYKYPNYANIPSTMALAALPKKTKKEVYEVIRDMELITLNIISLLFIYIIYQNIEIAKQNIQTINTSIIWLTLIVLAPIIIYYAIKMRRIYKNLNVVD
ncbi:hypothetical protein C9439_05740 [archaeon SCG-AAA382B04]|nr:hypothetical protein C9439_05740 [archaeon SCG-AAA382B04]